MSALWRIHPVVYPLLHVLYTHQNIHFHPDRKKGEKKRKKNLHVEIICVCVTFGNRSKTHFLLVLFFYGPEVIKVAYPFELEMKLENALCDTKTRQ